MSRGAAAQELSIHRWLAALVLQSLNPLRGLLPYGAPLQRHPSRLRVVLAVEQDAPPGWAGERGRLDAAMVQVGHAR